jgi:hypothetical protein
MRHVSADRGSPKDVDVAVDRDLRVGPMADEMTINGTEIIRPLSFESTKV